jgi:hypothetical protein
MLLLYYSKVLNPVVWYTIIFLQELLVSTNPAKLIPMFPQLHSPRSTLLSDPLIQHGIQYRMAEKLTPVLEKHRHSVSTMFLLSGAWFHAFLLMYTRLIDFLDAVVAWE